MTNIHLLENDISNLVGDVSKVFVALFIVYGARVYFPGSCNIQSVYNRSYMQCHLERCNKEEAAQ